MGLTVETWLFPIGSRFNNSPSLSLGNHALFIIVAPPQLVVGFFINFAYLHDAKTIMCWTARYTIGNDPNHRNITQPNRWWGFCLYLHTTINYNIHIMYLLMQPGSKLGILQSPPPWNNTILSVPIHRNTYTICTSNFKILQICPILNYLLELSGQAPRLP